MYNCQQVIRQRRRDSVLEPFEFNFDSKGENTVSGIMAFGHDPPEPLRNTYCSSESSCSATSPRDSLLPPLPPSLSPFSEGPVAWQSPALAQRWLPATPSTEQQPFFESPSKRSITVLQLEQLRRSTLPVLLQCKPVASAMPTPSSYPCPGKSSFSSASTYAASSTLNSPKSLVSNSDTVTTVGSSSSAPGMKGSKTGRCSQERKPTDILRPECHSSPLYGRSISLPLRTEPASPMTADFDLGLRSHDFEARRPSPAPPAVAKHCSNPALVPALPIPLGIPNSPSSPQGLQLPSSETSAFDSDTDDERPSPRRRAISKMVSQSRFKVSRARTDAARSEAVTTNTRTVGSGISSPNSVSSQNLKALGLSICDTSGNRPERGVTRASTHKPSTMSPSASSPLGRSSPVGTLRPKKSEIGLPSSRLNGMVKVGKASKNGGPRSKDLVTPAGGNAAESKAKVSSGKTHRNWFARLFRSRSRRSTTT